MTRVEVTEMLLVALRQTWQMQDDARLISDEAHLRDVLRGGCQAFLSGQFDDATDAISLGLAFLSLARHALLEGGRLEAIVERGAPS